MDRDDVTSCGLMLRHRKRSPLNTHTRLQGRQGRAICVVSAKEWLTHNAGAALWWLRWFNSQRWGGDK